MRIQDIANVFIGVLVNREIDLSGQFVYKMFNLKEYDANAEYAEIRVAKDLGDKLTKKGDLLVRLMSPNRIIYVGDRLEDLLVPSQLCVIRCDEKKINPAFLKWYLEVGMGKEDMASNLMGSSIQKISVASLKEIEIPMIDIEKQRAITDLIDLWDKEKRVMQDIMQEKDVLYNSLIEEMIENEG